MSPPHGDRSLHQRIAWGRTSRAPLREMTIEGVVMLAIGIPIRGAAIASYQRREASIARSLRPPSVADAANRAYIRRIECGDYDLHLSVA